MRLRILPTFLLVSAAAIAQNALWIDLSGEWRAITAEDRPQFAATDFDDSKWKPYLLPSDSEDLPARLWLRRVVQRALSRPGVGCAKSSSARLRTPTLS